jgi:hypothetical protein
MTKSQPPTDMIAVKLLRLWPDIATVARDLTLSHFTVAAWLRRGSIPVAYWDDLVKAARRRGIQGVTYATLRAVSVAAKAKKRATLTNSKANPVDGDATGIKAVRRVVQDALPVDAQVPPIVNANRAQAGRRGKHHAA